MKRPHNTSYIIFFCTLILSSISGCKKVIEVNLPIDKTTATTVYNNTGTASAVLSGIYFDISESANGLPLSGRTGLSFRCGLIADELIPFSPSDYTALYLYPNSFTDDVPGFWNNIYSSYLFRVNSAIVGISNSSGITASSKQVLLGEAKFLRAFFYFYLVNLYGDVPLITGVDFKVNSKVSRSSQDLVYQQIIADLIAAQEELSDNYLAPDLISATTERVRPNKATATALLARVYLYTRQWQKAEEEATKVINNSNFTLLADVNSVFLKNSKEAIWQVQPNPKGTDQVTGAASVNSADGAYFIPANPGDIPNVGLSQFLINAFEVGDLRKDAWSSQITSGADLYIIPYKYKAGIGSASQTEYQMVLRLAEQYLIRAEARAMRGNITGTASAQTDVDAIRSRARLPGTTANTPATMLDAIAQERKVELFTEWGDRWLDLKRTGKIGTVMAAVTPIKGGNWLPFKALFPIPFSEIKLNPNLKPQNPGYPSP